MTEITLTKAIPNYDPTKGIKFNTYLTTILNNELCSRYKKYNNNTYSLNEEIFDDQDFQSILTNGTNIEKEFIKKEGVAYIKEIIQSLSWKHRYSLINYYGLDGEPASVEDISRTIDCSVQRVYNLIEESIDFIRKKLEWDGVEV